MLNSPPLTISGENITPPGLASWVYILLQPSVQSCISEKCREVLILLEEDMLYDAIELYEEITAYNKIKTWH